MRRLVIATRNRGKLEEIRQILSDLNISVESLSDYPGIEEIEETGETFRENALEKAITVAKHTKQVVLADDSGLVVDALGGAPGVMSARYAGTGASDSDRYRKLLAAMESVPDDQRTARFMCVVAIATPEGRTWTVEGSVEGAITREPRGKGGFGYDPVFLVPELGLTFAEIDAKTKNHMSHRARALAKSVPMVEEALSI
ncbi:MAG: XTP/dITP diphosphatase [Firmicutes bacterium]|nr:XTP/dITP diphosphatase [Bacillota bacterium]MDD4337913.1 XTP/dITP diphosphatase [Bacillota bacterium]